MAAVAGPLVAAAGSQVVREAGTGLGIACGPADAETSYTAVLSLAAAAG